MDCSLEARVLNCHFKVSENANHHELPPFFFPYFNSGKGSCDTTAPQTHCIKMKLLSTCWETLGGRIIVAASSYGEGGRCLLSRDHTYYPAFKDYTSHSNSALVTLCKFSMSSHIADDSPSERAAAMAILHSPDHLLVYFANGEVEKIPLPFSVAGIFALNVGLLLQRKDEEGVVNSEKEGEGALPWLFTLSHPLEEVKPVSIRGWQGHRYKSHHVNVVACCGVDSRPSSSFPCCDDDNNACSNSSGQFVVTHEDGRHMIWHLESAKPLLGTEHSLQYKTPNVGMKTPAYKNRDRLGSGSPETTSPLEGITGSASRHPLSSRHGVHSGGGVGFESDRNSALQLALGLGRQGRLCGGNESRSMGHKAGGGRSTTVPSISQSNISLASLNQSLSITGVAGEPGDDESDHYNINPAFFMRCSWSDDQNSRYAASKHVFALSKSKKRGKGFIGYDICIVTGSTLRCFAEVENPSTQEHGRSNQLVSFHELYRVNHVVAAIGLRGRNEGKLSNGSWYELKQRFPCSTTTNSGSFFPAPSTETLALMEDGRLVLIHRGNILCNITCHRLSCRIIDICDPVGDVITCILEDGSHWRVRIHYGVKLGVAVETIAAIKRATGDDIALRLNIDVTRVARLSGVHYDGNPEWSALVTVLETLAMGKCSAVVAHGDAATTTTTEFSSSFSNWELVQASDFCTSKVSVAPKCTLDSITSGLPSIGEMDTTTTNPNGGLHVRERGEETKTIELLTSPHDLRDLWPQIIVELHNTHEDIKISHLWGRGSLKLSKLIASLCKKDKLNFPGYFTAYSTGHFSSALFGSGAPTTQAPTCFLLWLRNRILGCLSHTETTDESWKGVPNGRCSRISDFFRPLSHSTSKGIIRISSAAPFVVESMVKHGFRRHDLSCLILGIRLPLMQVLSLYRDVVPADSPTRVLELLGRTDLVALSQMENARNPGAEKLFSSYNWYDTATMKSRDGILESVSDSDGLLSLQKGGKLVFSDDQRLSEACRLLSSTRVPSIRAAGPVDASDVNKCTRQQAQLVLLCARIWATAVGRGMMTLGLVTPLLAEPIPIPPLATSGKVFPSGAMLNIDFERLGATELVYTTWPAFHNGVAAGLRLPAGRRAGITRTWIMYNKPSSFPSHSYGGFLLGLGLHGHLTTLSMTDVYEYLTQGQDTMTVGTLLGMAASYRGTADSACSKMLCLHVPSLLPPHLSSMEVSSTVRCAAIAGLGVLHMATGHRLMTEFLLNEIGRRCEPDRPPSDGDSYALTLGIALGMVDLGKGSDGGLSDLKVSQRLKRFVVGGRHPAMVYEPAKSDIQWPNSTLYQTTQTCCRIQEGESINTSMTSPGASLALGLLYLRSGNETVANWLSLPNTHFELDRVRPDGLMPRVVAQALIMWDKVQPTEQWADAQVPEFMRREMTRMNEQQQPLYGEENGHNVDSWGIHQAHTYITAGACLALGLRYAGTSSLEARDAIMKKLMSLKSLREGVKSSTTRAGGQVQIAEEKAVIHTACATAAIGLSMVMAGSGCVKCLRLVRELFVKTDAGTSFGQFMAFSEAIGLLFLGGGMATLGRSNECIAALVAAFYPYYPSFLSDNQFHLQALRHFYTLAVEQRGLSAVDVDSQESVSVPLSVRLRETVVNNVHCGCRVTSLTPEMSLVTPCTLSEGRKIASIELKSERHFPQYLNLRTLPRHMHVLTRNRILKV